MHPLTFAGITQVIPERRLTQQDERDMEESLALLRSRFPVLGVEWTIYNPERDEFTRYELTKQAISFVPRQTWVEEGARDRYPKGLWEIHTTGWPLQEAHFDTLLLKVLAEILGETLPANLKIQPTFEEDPPGERLTSQLAYFPPQIDKNSLVVQA
ncbi:MAG TPA: hypothetical protein V6C99_08325 [Oculatellaceae cyanobacterium]